MFNQTAVLKEFAFILQDVPKLAAIKCLLRTGHGLRKF